MHLLPLLDEILNVPAFEGSGDQNGWFLPSTRPVRRLGLALEPWPTLAGWITTERLDTLFLHRPWNLTDPQRQALQETETGVLAYHLAFDERLTTGFNPALAAACDWRDPEVLGHKQGRPLGMICSLGAPVRFETVADQLRTQFEGVEQVVAPVAVGAMVRRVAVVGAMTDALVREARERGAGVYVTGQWRQPASQAVRDTGLGVVVLGHRRSELWGLRTLARQLTELTDLEVIVAPA